MSTNLFSLVFVEDGAGHDITSLAIFGKKGPKVDAVIRTKEDLVVSGMALVKAFVIDRFAGVRFVIRVRDGGRAKKGAVLATLHGPVTSLLILERPVLNFLQRLSGIATQTAAVVAMAKRFGVAILDTRKTTPGCRGIEKMAVLHGGGVNHRMGLHDQYLIKDNHIDAAGSVTAAIKKVREHQRTIKNAPVIEVEVRTAQEFNEALGLGPNMILLDNMTPSLIARLVKERNAFCRNKNKVLLEVSGGVNPANIHKYLRLGVDRISLGALTHSVKAADISMKVNL